MTPAPVICKLHNKLEIPAYSLILLAVALMTAELERLKNVAHGKICCNLTEQPQP